MSKEIWFYFCIKTASLFKRLLFNLIQALFGNVVLHVGCKDVRCVCDTHDNASRL